jgi:hypothetical protein
VRSNGTETAGGLGVRKREVGGRGVGQKPKPGTCHSVTGVPCEMAVCSGTGRWWVQSNGTETAGGLRIHKCEVGGRGLGQKPETEHLALDFGHAM